MTEHNIIVCESCGVKYAVDVSNTCPVCGARRKPSIPDWKIHSFIDTMNQHANGYRMEYDDTTGKVVVRVRP